MERAAVIHHPENDYFYATGRNSYTVKLAVKQGDACRVFLHCRDKYIPEDSVNTAGSTVMRRVASDGLYDFYEADINADMLCVRYFFEMQDGQGETLYYGNYGFYEKLPEDIDDMFDCPLASREEESFRAPEWAAGKVVYQIFVDRFATDRDVPEEEWYRKDLTHRDSLRGNLRGITRSLPYLKKLGAEVLYLTPIFAANTTHKYDTVDYMRIDPDFGTEEELKELVQSAHEAGMRVILDAVFNHTSTDFFAFRDLLGHQEASRYRDWYYIEEFPLRSEGKPSYKCFSYFGGMPKLNCRNPEVREYLFGVVEHWTRACAIDGWRLDVADEIGQDFWRELRKRLRAVNPEALIVGEIWHFNRSFLGGDQWDSVMNYHFTRAVTGFLLEKGLSAEQFAEQLDFVRGRLKADTVPLLWNLIDSHDTDRFLTQADGRRELLKPAAAMQLLLPGMPMIYYGDELGMTGRKKGSACRGGMLWEKGRQDAELFSYYQRLIAIRKKYRALSCGEVRWKSIPGEGRVLSWESGMTGERTIEVLLNAGEAVYFCPEKTGSRELLTDAAFSGELPPYGVGVFEKG